MRLVVNQRTLTTSSTSDTVSVLHLMRLPTKCTKMFNFQDVFAPVADAALWQQRPTGLHMLHDIDLCEIFEYAHLKLTVSGRPKQANIHTHVRNEVTLVWRSVRLLPHYCNRTVDLHVLPRRPPTPNKCCHQILLCGSPTFPKQTPILLSPCFFDW